MANTLILLNGPPASGKSTLAERLVDLRPMSLDLDIDVVRGHLGRWLDQPHEAGTAARALAISMIDTHLRAGHDVVVPQLLAQTEFIERLEGAASDAGAQSIEIALEVTRAVAISAFDERRHAPTTSAHRDAADLVDRAANAGSMDPIGEMFDALQALLETRPGCHRIEAPRGDVDGTLAEILHTLSSHGIDWSSRSTSSRRIVQISRQRGWSPETLEYPRA